MMTLSWVGWYVVSGAPQPVHASGRILLGREREKHLSILICLLQPEVAFSPGAREWMGSLLSLSFTDTRALAGKCDPVGTWTRNRGCRAHL